MQLRAAVHVGSRHGTYQSPRVVLARVAACEEGRGVAARGGRVVLPTGDDRAGTIALPVWDKLKDGRFTTQISPSYIENAQYVD